MNHEGEICVQFTETEVTYLRRVASTLPVNQQSPFQKWAQLWTHVNRQFHQEKHEIDTKTDAIRSHSNGTRVMPEEILPDSSITTEEKDEQKNDDEPKKSRIPKRILSAHSSSPATTDASDKIEISAPEHATTRIGKRIPSNSEASRLRMKPTVAREKLDNEGRKGVTANLAPSSKATGNGTMVRKPIITVTRKTNVKNTPTTNSKKTAIGEVLNAGRPTAKNSKSNSTPRTMKTSSRDETTARKSVPKLAVKNEAILSKCATRSQKANSDKVKEPPPKRRAVTSRTLTSSTSKDAPGKIINKTKPCQEKST